MSEIPAKENSIQFRKWRNRWISASSSPNPLVTSCKLWPKRKARKNRFSRRRESWQVAGGAPSWLRFLHPHLYYATSHHNGWCVRRGTFSCLARAIRRTTPPHAISRAQIGKVRIATGRVSNPFETGSAARVSANGRLRLPKTHTVAGARQNPNYRQTATRAYLLPMVLERRLRRKVARIVNILQLGEDITAR